MSSIWFPFPVPLTARQYVYILIIQGLVAALIDAGANFGIAYAMYHSQSSVRMWVFSENTIAGDLGVTPLIQTAVSMIISSALIHSDLHHHAIRPLPFVWPHVEHLPDPRRACELFKRGTRVQAGEGTHKGSGTSSPLAEKPHQSEESRGMRYYALMLIRFIFEGTEHNMLLDWHGPGTFLQRIVLTGLQGLGLGVIFGFPLWCLAVVILGPIYGTGNMGNKWAPQVRSRFPRSWADADKRGKVIKLVYGFLTGLITNPVIALLALGSQAEHHLVYLDEGQDVEAPQPTVETGDLPAITEVGDLCAVGISQSASSPRHAPPTASRLRSESTTSHTTPARRDWGRMRRPSSTSFTANVSALGPMRSASTQVTAPGSPRSGLPSPGIALAPLVSPLPGLGSPSTIKSPARRPRALTASSTGTGSYYALGGTGGRAQRPTRGRASTVSNTGAPDDRGPGGGEGQEVLDDQGVAASVRVRSATTSNSTPLHGVEGWNTSARAVEMPDTPTREGRRRGMVRMLSGSRESMR